MLQPYLSPPHHGLRHLPVREPIPHNTEEHLHPGEARYLTILETDADDLCAALGEFEGSSRELLQQGQVQDVVDVVLTSVFRAIGPEFRSGAEKRKVSGLLVFLSNCRDEAREREFNDWYNKVHIPLHVLRSGRYHTAYRYESIDPKPGQSKYVSIYEMDHEDPGELATAMGRERPQWIAQDLYSPDIERVMRAAYTRIWP